MKKTLAMIVSLLLLITLLTACAQTKAPESTSATSESSSTAPSASEEKLFVFTRKNFPRMDGSTSMVPLGEAIASVLLGESREAVSDLTQFNRTTQSFRNLMSGECDILIVGEPNADVYTDMETQGFDADIETIATDALIFVVNESNPVDNLTTEQVRKIYSGEITNWSEVGGNDAPIVAFQRNKSAGSQALMVKLIMHDTPLAEAPLEYVADDMGMLMESVKSYDNSANAIGYSVYYYANDMKMAQGLKILSIDDVQPNAQTIRSGEYPHRNAYYCVIPADAPADSPNRILYDWLMTDEGQQLIAGEGYVSVKTFE
ncbi:MAG: PstS family phosphate ABC transporter substrate-binding protein [Faecousia sp.]